VYIDHVKACPWQDGSTDVTPQLDRELIRGERMPASNVSGVFLLCHEGSTFLTFYDQNSLDFPMLRDCLNDDPNGVSIRDGIADFTSLETEIEIVGPARISIQELRQRLR